MKGKPNYSKDGCGTLFLSPYVFRGDKQNEISLTEQLL